MIAWFCGNDGGAKVQDVWVAFVDDVYGVRSQDGGAVTYARTCRIRRYSGVIVLQG